jgi:hypothetical protein
MKFNVEFPDAKISDTVQHRAMTDPGAFREASASHNVASCRAATQMGRCLFANSLLFAVFPTKQGSAGSGTETRAVREYFRLGELEAAGQRRKS